MRKSLTIFSLSLFTVLLLSACDPSKKGAWSEARKKEFTDACVGAMKGEQDKIKLEDGKEICSCAMKKLEAGYAPVDVPEKEAEKAGADCAREVLAG